MNETLEARIARLTKEVQETQRELLDTNKNAKFQSSEQKLEGLSNLENVLQNLHSSIALQNIDSKSLEAANKADVNSKLAEKFKKSLSLLEENESRVKNDENSKKSTGQIQKIAELEARIASLEKVVGLDELNTSSEEYRPIVATLQEIKKRLKLVTSSPAALENSVNNLRNLIEVIDKFALLRAKQSDTINTHSVGLNRKPNGNLTNDDQAVFFPASLFNTDGTPTILAQQVSTLYSKISLVENFEIILPKVLQRLNILRSLHTDSLTVIESIKDFDSVALALKMDINSWKDSIENTNKRLDNFEKITSENLLQVKSWMEDLQKRI